MYSEQFGVADLPLRMEYSKANSFDEMQEQIKEEKLSSRFREVKERQAGDIVCLMIGKFTSHVGIVCGDNSDQVLHIVEGSNAVIEKLDGLRWGSRIESYWRLSG